MASDRAKLALDEQSFQGLLAAAFTIQEHNARMNGAEQADGVPTAATPAASVAAAKCTHCGANLADAGASCPKCSAADSRQQQLNKQAEQRRAEDQLRQDAEQRQQSQPREPQRQGEQLQRKWASLWLMSQEQGSLDARRKPSDDDFPLSPGDPGRPITQRNPGRVLSPVDTSKSLSGADQARPSAPDPSRPFSAADATASRPDPPNGRTLRSVVAQAEPAAPTHDVERGGAFHGEHDGEFVEERIEWPETMPGEPAAPPKLHNFHDDGEPTTVEPGVVEGASVGPVIDGPVIEDDFFGEQENEKLDLASGDSVHTADSEPDAAEQGSGRDLKHLRVKLRFRRADVYLGLSVLVAAFALLWPTGGSGGAQKPSVTPLERILIAVGIAEEQQPEAHFSGDPDLKVWVDPHTALYYCPGDELYGKSPNGHYTTQREAQADRFEPAERSVCIQ